jgi:hypothetical protein
MPHMLYISCRAIIVGPQLCVLQLIMVRCTSTYMPRELLLNLYALLGLHKRRAMKRKPKDDITHLLLYISCGCCRSRARCCSPARGQLCCCCIKRLLLQPRLHRSWLLLRLLRCSLLLLADALCCS